MLRHTLLALIQIHIFSFMFIGSCFPSLKLTSATTGSRRLGKWSVYMASDERPCSVKMDGQIDTQSSQ